MRIITFNDVFAVVLIAFGMVGAFVAIYWREYLGAVLCATLVGYGLGIYADRSGK